MLIRPSWLQASAHYWLGVWPWLGPTVSGFVTIFGLLAGGPQQTLDQRQVKAIQQGAVIEQVMAFAANAVAGDFRKSEGSGNSA